MRSTGFICKSLFIFLISFSYYGWDGGWSYSFSSFTTDLTDRTDLCPMAIKQIKKFVPFPRLTPLQPDAYGHPRKRASLSAPPHPSGLPAGRRKASNQNSCPWQYKMSLQRRLLTDTSDLPGAHPLAYCPPGRVLVVGYLYRGRCPRLLKVVPSRHRSAYGVLPSTPKGLQAHSPGQSEATPWVMGYII